jgi:hypothetical protein
MNTDNWFIKSSNFKTKIPTPPLQAIGVLIISFLMMLAGIIIGDETFPWLVSGAFSILFLVFNNAIGIFAENHFKYIQFSLYSFMGLIVSLALLAYALSGKSIFADGAVNRTIFIVLILAYFSLMGISVLIRNVAEFLKEKDDKLHKN